MNILYDYQILMGQRYGGISRYYFELANCIKENHLAQPYFKVPFSINEYFRNYPGIKTIKHRMETKGDPFLKIDKWISLNESKKEKYDIIHPTYYDPYLIGKTKGKIVITVYDMIHELYTEFKNSPDGTIVNKKKMIYAADHIIAISESTKRDILKLYPDIPESKISVIYIASNFKPVVDDTKEYGFPKKYILFVGNRGFYKNFNNFFNAVKELLVNDSKLNLVCLGGGPFSESEKELQTGVEKQIVQMNVTDEILSYGYAHAECFVFPSMYEGFGIPTLEAFASNCPVVLSNTSSMPEVGGDAAVYINPYDINDIKDKISMVINNESLRRVMISKGQEQLKKFNWTDIAKQTVECYISTLNGQG